MILKLFVVSFFIKYTHSVLLSATPYQTYPDNLYTRFTLGKNFLKDVDIVSIEDNGFYGLPWTYFLNPRNSSFPNIWYSNLLEIKKWIGDTPVFLSLSMFDQRGCPTRNATVDHLGHLHIKNFKGCDKCLNFTEHKEIQAAYISYVLFMIDFYDPQYINIAVEINSFRVACGLELFNEVIKFSNNVYSAVHKEHPEAIVFPSFVNGYLLQGEPCLETDNVTTCIDKHLEELSDLKRDRFGLSTYPFLTQKVFRIPFSDNFLQQTLDRALEYDEKVLITETGWTTSSIIVDMSSDPREVSPPPNCITPLSGNISMAVDYLKYVLRVGDQYDMDLVAWFSFYDVLPKSLVTLCPVETQNCKSKGLDERWCQELVDARMSNPSLPRLGEFLYKVFGQMGFVSYDLKTGNELLDIWRDYREKKI